MEIAKTLGKVDEFGQVAEDLRGQILGQLSERLSYDRLYQDAVRDPRLVRTRQELEVAIDNARAARRSCGSFFRTWRAFVSTNINRWTMVARAWRAWCAIFKRL